ncbi:phosphatidylserine decarboxylase [Seongchinamella unica]|uniref:Phosphatidylserine decarboxylase n=1 Tax=Seongchinamella unica TaxID=2547392 RepID=A0A4R5LMW4_9GAMM|nr:phosphatidylserine decarboxylase [Seongchinamella unica]TDG11264.1 phosphatidylserine decarboxylase [Seongchinamella unica]
MKGILVKSISIVALVILMFTGFQPGAYAEDAQQPLGGAAAELAELLESAPQVREMLAASIEKAKQINPDGNSNPVQSVDDYLEFVSWAETAMPWSLLYQKDYPDIYDDTFQSLVYFHFLVDQSLPQLEGRGLVNDSLQYAEPFASWIVSFSRSWGSYLDTEESWNERNYQLALENPAYGLQNGWYEAPSNWSTFNDFFARYLRSPAQRPIAEPEDNSVVVSYADSTPQGVWAIDDDSMLVVEDGAPIKSSSVRSIRALLGENSGYRDAFAGGSMTHSFLDVNDYHRYHFPLAGTVKEVSIIPGINPSGGSVWWDASNRRYAFNPGSRLGWQSVETRGLVVLDTGAFGLVALLPIGMSAVSSVSFEDTVKPGAVVEKGDMLGHFAFGGSDFVMLFQKGVNFTIEAPEKDGGDYGHLLMGERLGNMKLEANP